MQSGEARHFRGWEVLPFPQSLHSTRDFLLNVTQLHNTNNRDLYMSLSVGTAVMAAINLNGNWYHIKHIQSS